MIFNHKIKKISIALRNFVITDLRVFIENYTHKMHKKLRTLLYWNENNLLYRGQLIKSHVSPIS